MGKRGVGLDPSELTGRVVDLAGVLESEQKTRIIQLLEGHEAATTQQFAVLILPGLEGDALEDFSIRTVENGNWEPGRRTMVCSFWWPWPRKNAD